MISNYEILLNKPFIFKVLIFAVLIIGANRSFSQNQDGEIHLPSQFDYSYIHIKEASVEGNKRTRDRIIIRELDFSIGDSLATFQKDLKFGVQGKRFISTDSSEIVMRLKYSRENIVNTKLFLTVDIYVQQLETNNYKLHIKVHERWYFWAFPVVRIDAPNFNEWLKDPDFADVSMGIFTSHNNLWGLSHQASLAVYGGSSSLYGLGYYIPWIGKGQKTGLRMNAVYSNSSNVEYGSAENERLMIYEKNSLKEVTINAKFTFRPGLYNYGTLNIGADFASISDSLFSLTDRYFPDGKQSISTLTLYLDYYYDSRNSKSYPLKGNLMRVFIDKKGLGIISHDIDLFHYGIDFHFYQKLSKKFFVAEMVKAVKSSSVNAPYYYQQSLNSDGNFIRGFDYYTLKGDEMVYFRANIKYELVAPRVKGAKKGKEESKFKNIQYAFYLNFFSDAGYVWNDYTTNNPYNNKMLFSWGLGLDFVSYYDLVLRFEYAFTSIGTHGFFFGFGMPI